ncbi:MAG TPA: DUF401 family protein [candidate division Zixibacteria bacterium]|nr:DUF401 family protein [candidate division Zixibacteria bacterium]
MSATLSIIIATTAFVIAVRLKAPLGLSFAGCGILLGFLSGMSAVDVIMTTLRSIVMADTVKLIVIVYFLSLMGRLLTEMGWLSRTVTALQRLIPIEKVSAVLPASIIGLLPMPGGAMLSAPLVQEGARSLDIDRGRLTFLNFWFRHIWEYAWPLYPGIVISTVLLSTPASELIASMWPLTIFAILPGFIIGFRGVPKPQKAHENNISRGTAIRDFFLTSWYIWAVVIFVLFLGFEILPIVVMAGLITLLFLRQDDEKRIEHLKKNFSINIVTLIAGVMVFKGMLETGGSVERLAVEMANVPDILILFIVPFAVGIITGVNSAFVGIGFPVLVPIIMRDGFSPGYFAFAYAAGFAGVLVSPVHLCLLLTKQYFGAKWGEIYRFLVPATLIVFLAAIALFFIHG